MGPTNPTTGTFTQQDTLDAPLDPANANANRYAYAGNDLINNIDPLGEFSYRTFAKYTYRVSTGMLAVLLVLELVHSASVQALASGSLAV